MPDDLSKIRKEREQELLRYPNVIGIDVGYKKVAGEKTSEKAILVLVRKKVAEEKLKPRHLVPKEIDAAPTDVIEVGEVKILPELQGWRPGKIDVDFLVKQGANVKQLSKTIRLRPCPMGTSGGNYRITAGTNGELVKSIKKDETEGEVCIGTNWHVGKGEDGQLGDPYLQPGVYDGGKNPDDRIGSLLRYYDIHFLGEPSECPVGKVHAALYNGPAKLFGAKTRLQAVAYDFQVENEVDGSLIAIDNLEDVLAERFDDGSIAKDVKQCELDAMLNKSGRTTCLTSDGHVAGVDTTINVQFGVGKYALFVHQIMVDTPGWSAGGDSGSLMRWGDYATGKLFAGSDLVTIGNHYQTWLNLLEAELITSAI